MDDIKPTEAVKTMDLTPTWESLVPVFRAVIEDGTPESAEAMWAEITRMGKVADAHVEATKWPDFTAEAVWACMILADPGLLKMVEPTTEEACANAGKSHIPLVTTAALSVLVAGWADNNINEAAMVPLNALTATFGPDWPAAFLRADWRDYAREPDPLEEMLKALAETGIQIVRL